MPHSGISYDDHEHLLSHFPWSLHYPLATCVDER